MSTIELPQVKNPSGLQPTDIEWADYAFNPLRAIDSETGKVGWACQKVSDGCKNCYAEAINKRFGTGQPFSATGMKRVKVVLDDQRIAAALKFRIPKGFKGKAGDGRPKVFVCDMTDIFGDWVPFDLIDKLFAVMALRPDVTFQILTKRPERMTAYLEQATATDNLQEEMDRLTLEEEGEPFAFNQIADGGCWPLPNVWLGTSVENQQAADERIPHLLKCPASVRFLSCEPLLEDVDLANAYDCQLFDMAMQ